MKSMTGYGTAEGQVGKGRLFVEIKSINHRFSEFNVKIPGRMTAIENKIRQLMRKRFLRGKVDIFFKEKHSLFGAAKVSIDLELAKRYQLAIKKLHKDLEIKADPDFLQTVGLDRIFTLEERTGSYERLWSQMSRLVTKACDDVEKMRKKEGAHIQKDQRARLTHLQKLIASIKKRSKNIRSGHIEKIRSKMNGTFKNSDLDEQRLQMEAAYLGGRQDIAEELVRLDSHIKQYRDLVRSRDSVGRKLDFLLQEMNREANTIGSKAADAKISQAIVECKSELERLREQVQNIE